MGLKDLFKGKSHREKYEKAEKDFRRASDSYRMAGTGQYSGNYFRSWPQAHYDFLIKNENEAKKRLKDLYNSGHKDAIKLNKRYDSLIKNLKETYEKLNKFEKEDLKMKDRKNIGQILGVFSIGSLIIAGIFGSTFTGNIIWASKFFNGFSISTVFLILGFVFGIAYFITKRN